MVAIHRRLRYLACLIAGLMLLQVLPIRALAQDVQTAVINVRFEVVGELAYVYYDLRGPAPIAHNVRLVLYRESTPLFVYRPVNLTGDVGTVVFPGEKRRIVWDFTKEFPEGLIGADYYFIVEADRPEQESSKTWLWVGGGVAVVGGVLALLLLGGNESTPPPPSSTFPNPPGRP
jgi:hypothetical protein